MDSIRNEVLRAINALCKATVFKQLPVICSKFSKFPFFSYQALSATEHIAMQYIFHEYVTKKITCPSQTSLFLLSQPVSLSMLNPPNLENKHWLFTGVPCFSIFLFLYINFQIQPHKISFFVLGGFYGIPTWHRPHNDEDMFGNVINMERYSCVKHVGIMWTVGPILLPFMTCAFCSCPIHNGNRHNIQWCYSNPVNHTGIKQNQQSPMRLGVSCCHNFLQVKQMPSSFQ